LRLASRRGRRSRRFSLPHTCPGYSTRWRQRARGSKDSHSWTTWRSGQTGSRRRRWRKHGPGVSEGTSTKGTSFGRKGSRTRPQLGPRNGQPQDQVGTCPHGCVSGECRQPAGRLLLVVRPGQQLWDATNARPPVQALPAVERSTGPAVGKGQGGDEEGEAEVESGGPLGG